MDSSLETFEKRRAHCTMAVDVFRSLLRPSGGVRGTSQDISRSSIA
jgi:hypothetical protein